MVTKETDIKKQVEYYMSLPYTMTVKFRPEQGGYYVASYFELPDLTMTGNTPEEAVKELLAEKPEWFEECLKLGLPIPQPVEPQKYSGKIVLRIPPSLHESLIRISSLEGVSLNQYMLSALSRALGYKEAEQRKTGSKN
ncbi:MAG TPA: toxin-antitoxin system HicB family antitoxin [Dehalococcoidales bacterium]|nr:toxin-antitoxin system HicB family antitoxin [Dehalococcoidales bacterium]